MLSWTKHLCVSIKSNRENITLYLPWYTYIQILRNHNNLQIPVYKTEKPKPARVWSLSWYRKLQSRDLERMKTQSNNQLRCTYILWTWNNTDQTGRNIYVYLPVIVKIKNNRRLMTNIFISTLLGSHVHNKDIN